MISFFQWGIIWYHLLNSIENRNKYDFHKVYKINYMGKSCLNYDAKALLAYITHFFCRFIFLAVDNLLAVNSQILPSWCIWQTKENFQSNLILVRSNQISFIRTKASCRQSVLFLGQGYKLVLEFLDSDNVWNDTSCCI